MNATSELTVRCNAYGDGVRAYRVAVDVDGSVRVWDRVAGHYTCCHRLGERQQARIRKLAR